MLIDEFLPTYTVSEYHCTEVRAPAPHVYAMLRATDFSAAPIMRRLFWLRSVLGRLSARSFPPQPHQFTVDTFLKSGAILLGERPVEELLLGLVGQFWKPSGATQRLTSVGFRQFNQPGYAKAVINFSLVQ